MGKVRAVCPHCGQGLTVSDEYVGQAVQCPSCRGVLELSGEGDVSAASAPKVAPAGVRPKAGGGGQGVLTGAFMSFLAGVAVMVLSMGTVIYYAPIFAVAAILAVVALTQGKGPAGGFLLVLSVGVPLIWQFMVVSPGSAGGGAVRPREGGGLGNVGQSLRERFGSSEPARETATAQDRESSLRSVEVLQLEGKLYRVARRKVAGVRFKLRNNGTRRLRDVEVTVSMSRADGSTITEQKFHPLQANLGEIPTLNPGQLWEMSEGSFLPFDAKISEADMTGGTLAAKVTGVDIAN